MKLLIAYDGSACSKIALEDLKYAGLPDKGVEVRILTVGEFGFSPSPALNLDPNLSILAFTAEQAKELTTSSLEAAEFSAEEGKEIVHTAFPEWEIKREATLNSPASGILEAVQEWKPDLIVMGSHGRGRMGRMFLGSVSMRVASEAACSVRIAKRYPRGGEPVIVLAFDGSEDSRRAVHTLVHRNWPQETLLHIVTVVDSTLLGSLDYISFVGKDLYEERKEEESHLEHLIHSLEHEMKKHFRSVTSTLRIGSPSHEILKEAERLNADTIFLGSRGLSKLERLLLGSVAHGVSAYAEATVEIVR